MCSRSSTNGFQKLLFITSLVKLFDKMHQWSGCAKINAAILFHQTQKRFDRISGIFASLQFIGNFIGNCEKIFRFN